MELKEVIKKRRSIRKYKEKDIDENIINSIIEAGRLSPSAKNVQPWKFYIAKKEIKNKIADLMIDYHKNNPINTYGMFTTATVIKQAPVLILVFKDSDNNFDRNDALSIGACIQNMLLTATDLNVGSLWIAATFNVREKISKLVNTNLELYSVIAIGHSDENPEARPRKPFDNLFLN